MPVKKYSPVDLDQTQANLQLSFPGAYAELAERRFTSNLLKDANALRVKRENSDPKSEWADLFKKTPN